MFVDLPVRSLDHWNYRTAWTLAKGRDPIYSGILGQPVSFAHRQQNQLLPVFEQFSKVQHSFYHQANDTEIPDSHLSDFAQEIQKAISEIQKGTQIAKKLSDELSDDQSQNLLKSREVHLIKSQNKFIDFFNSVDLNNIIGLFDTASQLVAKISKNKASTQLCASILKAMSPLVSQFQLIIELQTLNFISFHRSVSKFNYIMLKLAISVLQEGFCISELEEQKQEGDLQVGDEEEAGMGEGEGINDVSEKMDNEDQIQGEKYDTQNEQQPDPNQRIDKPDEGIEMENDFEGTVHDVDQPEPQEQNEDEDEKSEEDEPERQMGETDNKTEEIIDEKLWDDDDEREDGNETNEVDPNQAPGEKKQGEQDLVANEDELSVGEDKDNGRDQKKNQSDPNQAQEEEEGDMDEDSQGEGTVQNHRKQTQLFREKQLRGQHLQPERKSAKRARWGVRAARWFGSGQKWAWSRWYTWSRSQSPRGWTWSTRWGDRNSEGPSTRHGFYFH